MAYIVFSSSPLSFFFDLFDGLAPPSFLESATPPLPAFFLDVAAPEAILDEDPTKTVFVATSFLALTTEIVALPTSD